MFRLFPIFAGSALILGACAQDASSLSEDAHEIQQPVIQKVKSEPKTPVKSMAGTVTDQAEMLDDAAWIGYDKLLKLHVDDDGWVDYKSIKEDHKALDAYVATLVKPMDPKSDSSVRLAHLINAYNAFTLKLIVDSGLPNSIMDLEGGKPWDAELWNLGGEKVSLNHIEHELIRPVFEEPRIHWALVCAAFSCPPLRNEAYTSSDLEDQLSAQEAYVLNFDHSRYAKQVDAGVLITPLFDWYGGDFGDWKAYAAKRLGVGAASFGAFLDYQWQLNSQDNAR